MRSARFGVVALLMIWSGFFAAESRAQSSPGAVVEGTVVDGSDKSIANAMLQWSAVGVAGSGTDSSDPQGRFAFQMPVSAGPVQVQIAATANLYLPAQVSVLAQPGQTTSTQIVLSLKPKTQLATVTGSLTNSITHKPIPGAHMSILGAGGVLSAITSATGAFRFTKVGFNSNLTIEAETLETPCIATTDFPLSVSLTIVSVKLTAPVLHVHTPECPNNTGINFRTSPTAPPGAPLSSIDDTLQWKQADQLAIQTDATTNAWNAGHVNGILRGPAGTGLITASDEGESG